MDRWRRMLAALAAMALALTMTGVGLAQDSGDPVTYRADLKPLNADTVGSETLGHVTITVSGDEVTIDITVEGAPPSMQHWQHFHGFADSNKEAACPTMAADANGDGIIDLIETEPVAGTTMVPFNDDPVAMNIPADTYPEADADGNYTYSVTVSMSELEKAFGEAFPNGDGLNLEHRIVFIHGVPAETELPQSVQSLGDIPPQVTLPIACGNLELEQGATLEASPMATPSI